MNSRTVLRALRPAVLTALLAGCGDEGVDLVTREEGCYPYEIGALLETRLVGTVLVDEAEPETGALDLHELRDEAAVYEWYQALGLSYSEYALPTDWELPDFQYEMGVVVPFAQWDVVGWAHSRGVVGFYDAGPADRVVAVYELRPECQDADYNPLMVALHAVPIGNVVSCSFGQPEEC